MKSRMLYLAIAVLLVPVLYLAVVSAMAQRPANLGVRNGRLVSCPDSPNCVCSQDGDPAHQVAPLPFEGDAAAAMQRLKQAIAKIPRTRIVTETEDYLHVEATSLVFRFVDDVEFFVDRTEHVIHVRSASRAGRSDLGVNRARVAAIRQAFERRAAP